MTPTYLAAQDTYGLLGGGSDLPSTNKHVLLLSVDGLHEADLEDPNLAGDLTNILNLGASGVTYTNAFTSQPSDSFPGTLAYLTGAGPATTGVYYDDSYARDLNPPPGNSSAGTVVSGSDTGTVRSLILRSGGELKP